MALSEIRNVDILCTKTSLVSYLQQQVTIGWRGSPKASHLVFMYSGMVIPQVQY